MIVFVAVTITVQGIPVQHSAANVNYGAGGRTTSTTKATGSGDNSTNNSAQPESIIYNIKCNHTSSADGQLYMQGCTITMANGEDHGNGKIYHHIGSINFEGIHPRDEARASNIIQSPTINVAPFGSSFSRQTGYPGDNDMATGAVENDA